MSWLFDTLLNGRVYTRDAIIVYRILLFLVFIIHYTLIDKSMYMHECVCYIKTLSFAWIVINHFKFHSHAFYMAKKPCTRVSDSIRFGFNLIITIGWYRHRSIRLNYEKLIHQMINIPFKFVFMYFIVCYLDSMSIVSIFGTFSKFHQISVMGAIKDIQHTHYARNEKDTDINKLRQKRYIQKFNEERKNISQIK